MEKYITYKYKTNTPKSFETEIIALEIFAIEENLKTTTNKVIFPKVRKVDISKLKGLKIQKICKFKN